jgi:hypothetical protein
MQQLATLSRDADINEAVRYGDIYAVLITHNVRKKNYKKVSVSTHMIIASRQAAAFCDELQKRVPNIDMSSYIKPAILELIESETGKTGLSRRGGDVGANGDIGDDGDISVPESMALKRRASMAQENIFNTDNLIFS